MNSKVLVIEDDALMASLLSEKLSKSGFTVSLAADGETAFKELDKELPDIILLDLILPGMHGFDVLSELKKNEKTKQIPVIILSNLGSREEIQKGLRMGADDYMIKANVLIDEVVSKVETILKNKKT